jgi:hypothetical protein
MSRNSVTNCREGAGNFLRECALEGGGRICVDGWSGDFARTCSYVSYLVGSGAVPAGGCSYVAGKYPTKRELGARQSSFSFFFLFFFFLLLRVGVGLPDWRCFGVEWVCVLMPDWGGWACW